VALTVTDDDGESRTVHQNVTVTDPPPNQGPTASFTENVQFLDATLTSTSTDPDGNIATYDWDFGDGSPHGTTATVAHSYASAGSWNVILTVTDDDGAPSTTSHMIATTDPPANLPPTPSFTSSSLGLTATFTSTSTDSDGTVVDWQWDFGDGTFGSGQSVQHLYLAPGTLNVKLTVKDDDGAEGSITQPVTISAAPVGFAADLFTRTVANGLGTADLGGPWTLSGAATSFSVSGGAGRIAGAVAGNRAGYLAAVRQRDVEMVTDLALDRSATGGGAYVSVIGRRVSNGNDYRVKVRYLAGNTVAAYLVRTQGGVETTLASTTIAGLTLSPGDVLRVKLQVNGAASTNVRAKVWRASAAEPVGWLLTNTSAAPAALQVPGDTGVLLYTSSSWTGTAATLAVDNYSVGPVLTP
jgi:PKD repeat protein